MVGNVFEGHPDWTRDNYAAVQWGVRGGRYSADVSLEKFRQPDQAVVAADRPATQSAEAAYRLVLANAGASKSRDLADQRVVRGVRDRNHRRIDSQKEVGGWPVLKSALAPVDSDGDGMPDTWEADHGLDARNPDDRNNDRDSDGYTNLEEYLNSLVPLAAAS